MNIRRLTPSDAPRFQALRLAAQLETPEAFGASHAEEQGMSREDVERRLAERPGHAMFGAFDGDTLTGFVVFAREADAMRVDGQPRDDLRMHLRFAAS